VIAKQTATKTNKTATKTSNTKHKQQTHTQHKQQTYIAIHPADLSEKEKEEDVIEQWSEQREGLLET